MPGFSSVLQKAASYVGMPYGIGSNLYGRGVARFGRANMGTMTGAGVGAAYGATLGRDQGQSMLGGAFTGALGGAAMGRYGAAAAGGMGRRLATRQQMARASSGWMGFGQVAAGVGGRTAFRQLRRDGLAARKFIGQGINKGMNAFSARRPRTFFGSMA